MPFLQALHVGQQRTVLSGASALGPRAPGIISASRDFEHAAHETHRPGVFMLLDEAKPHLGTSAKMPMVGSSGRCNGLGQGSAWCSEAKGLPRARVEFEGNGI